jgi:hypothetical protein
MCDRERTLLLLSCMLDYRAHKLYWLLYLPIRLAVRISFFIIIAASIIIAESTSYRPVIKIVIAFVLFELIGILALLCIWTPLNALFKRMFFWLVDVSQPMGEMQKKRDWWC